MTGLSGRIWKFEQSEDGHTWGPVASGESVTAHIRAHLALGDWILWDVQETQDEMVIVIKHYDFVEWRRFRTARW